MSNTKYHILQLDSLEDGVTLYVHLWPTKNATGWVHIMHGMSEHGGRYDGLAKVLNSTQHLICSYPNKYL